ncbi:MAG TPA: LD-carboxypeptidase [Victivallales bacterium]|nr:LD-carboxypeptidase [Victivallales bacterium]
MVIFPEKIKKIAVIAPAGVPNETDFNASLRFVESLGYDIKIGNHIFNNKGIDYLSSSIENRVTDIHSCWKDDSIDLVIAAKGGFGSAQLLPFLNWELLKTRNLPFVGYSDLTALHLGMYAKGVGIPISAPMFCQFHKLRNDNYTLNSLCNSIQYARKAEQVTEVRHHRKLLIIKKRSIEAEVLPVTLSVLVSLIGTSFMPDVKGRILLIEDINEPVYKLDRYLTHLMQAGILNRISGLLCGYFTRCGNQKERIELFNSWSKFVNGPVIMNIPFGHTYPRISIAFGERCIVKDNGEIILDNC